MQTAFIFRPAKPFLQILTRKKEYLLKKSLRVVRVLPSENTFIHFSIHVHCSLYDATFELKHYHDMAANVSIFTSVENF